jgi:hypothetical protein
MNLQHWIDQYPWALAVIFLIYFLCLWCLVAAIVSLVGGWFSLAKLCRTWVPFKGAKWRMQSGRMRRLTNYHNVLTLSIRPRGFVFGDHPHEPDEVLRKTFDAHRCEAFAKLILRSIYSPDDAPLGIIVTLSNEA